MVHFFRSLARLAGPHQLDPLLLVGAQQRLSRDFGAGVLQLKVLAQRVGPDVQVALGALERPVRARP